MKRITSRDNAVFRRALRLTRKKYRDLTGEFLIEGPNLVGEAVKCGAARLVIAREGSGYEETTPDTAVFAEDLFDRLTDTEHSQGVLAVAGKPGADRKTHLWRQGKDLVILDRLQDPGNIGTILRTCDGAGIGGAVLMKGTCDPFSQKAVRACAGSILRVPVETADDPEELLAGLREAGVRTFVTVCRDGSSLYEPGAFDGGAGGRALIIGNEGNGVSETFSRGADVRVTIPMAGKLESLNASVAAALVIYEMKRRSLSAIGEKDAGELD